MEHLGRQATDIVTGFSGTITAVTHYQYGAPRACVTALIDGKPVSEWFDIAQLST